MAYPTLSTSLKSAGISKIYAKASGDTDWQSLGFIRNGELKIVPYSTEDTHKRNHAHAFTIEAKVELLDTLLANLETIPTLVDGGTSFLFQLTDAGAIPASSTATAGWVVVSSSQVGATAKYQSDGNPSTNQFIELTIKGSVTGSLDTIVKASINGSSDNTGGDFYISSSTTQTFSGFATYSSTTAGDNVGIKGDIKPNGFSSVALQDASSGSYISAGKVRNGKIICDFIAEEDSLNRPSVYGVDVDIEYELLVADSTNMLLLDSLNTTNTNVQITLLDGKIFTLASKLGVGISFENIGDFDKMRVLKFSHKGRILTSDFAGIVSV